MHGAGKVNVAIELISKSTVIRELTNSTLSYLRIYSKQCGMPSEMRVEEILKFDILK